MVEQQKRMARLLMARILNCNAGDERVWQHVVEHGPRFLDAVEDTDTLKKIFKEVEKDLIEKGIDPISFTVGLVALSFIRPKQN